MAQLDAKKETNEDLFWRVKQQSYKFEDKMAKFPLD